MLTVNDLMTVDPLTITSDTPLRRIFELMKREGCRQLPVLDGDRVVGIVTDRDIRLVMNSPIVLHERWQDVELLDKVAAEGVMTPNPITVSPDTPAYKAAEMLSTYKFGALPVVDDEMLVGIITVTDFLDHVSGKRMERVISI
jgi:acetoin utilization protein AcuB